MTFPGSQLNKISRQNFAKSGIRIRICSGEIIITQKTDCEKTKKQSHESTVEGHKGISQTYWQIREKYY